MFVYVGLFKFEFREGLASPAKISDSSCRFLDNANADIAVFLEIGDNHISGLKPLKLHTELAPLTGCEKAIIAGVSPTPMRPFADIHEIDTVIKVETGQFLV
jgi:hypothetical protein